MRILIADDDEAFLEILQSYLWDRGHEAEIASDGLECITILRDFAPDVLLLERDLLWGGSDGVLAQMRDDPLIPRIPVILMTDSPEEFDALTNPIVVALLRKPFRLSDLLEQIASAVHAERFADASYGKER
jgi:CheY-like chemotaxis protein